MKYPVTSKFTKYDARILFVIIAVSFISAAIAQWVLY